MERGRKTTHHPIYRFRVKMAAIGSVEDSVDWNSGLSLDLAGGSWYGTTRGIVWLATYYLARSHVHMDR